MKQVKILREKYKTFEGARKRAAFENMVAKGEFEKGYKAHLYYYITQNEGDAYRVIRCKP